MQGKALHECTTLQLGLKNVQADHNQPWTRKPQYSRTTYAADIKER